MSSPSLVEPPKVDRPRRLVRSRDDRMIAGVAGGIARHLGVDAVIIRLVFVALALIGGGGVLAYLIAWVVIPEPSAEDEPSLGVATDGSGTSMIAGLLLVAVGAVLLADLLVPNVSWRFVAPVLLIMLGGLLLARDRESR